MMITPWMHQRVLDEIEEVRTKLREVISDKAGSYNSFKSDNYDPGFHYICDLQATLSRKLVELEMTRDSADIVCIEDQSEIVKIGNRLSILYDNGEQEEIKLTLEGDIVVSGDRDKEYPSVSTTSPIGRKVKGMRIGERGSLNLGGKTITLTVLEILPPKL